MSTRPPSTRPRGLSLSILATLAYASAAATPGFSLADEPANADWVGFRGGAARSGQVEARALPPAFEVVWTFDASEHFQRPRVDSSPAIAADAIYIGLGELSAFSSSGQVICLDATSGELRWSHRTRTPVFSSPAVVGGRVFVGEGYHQDSECVLHCLDARTGASQWTFPTKSHVESSPFVAAERVYFGAGEDGLYALEIEGGKLAWHFSGEHVDTAPLVSSGLVFAGIGYGDFAALCLAARDGAVRWRTPLDLPVWGAPVRVGGRVYFGLGNGSLVRSDETPRGAVVCLSAASGKLVWRRDLSDAVLSALGHAEGRILTTSRDGHLYALDAASGEIAWKRSLGAPIVASPLIGERAVIAVSEAGRVARVAIDSGELIEETKLGSTGPCLSSPAADGRRLVLGAGSHIFALGARIEGTDPKTPASRVGPATLSAKPSVRADRVKRTVSIDVVSCDTDVYPELKGAIEYVLVAEGGKAYEALFETAVDAAEIVRAFQELRLPPGRPAGESEGMPSGVPFRVWVEQETPTGEVSRTPIDDHIAYLEQKTPLAPAPWIFTGSSFGFDPETRKPQLECLATKHLVGLHFMDRTPLFQNSRAEARSENLYRVNQEVKRRKGTPARLVFEEMVPEPMEGIERVHVYVTGRVQGVGFRVFTQRTARRLGLTGNVRNLPDGRVEAAVEGPKEKVAELLRELERGPRAAQVQSVDAQPIPARGDWKSFEILR